MWFDGRSETKILNWREFRNNLSNWPDDIALVAEAWKQAPTTNRYLCTDNLDIWPDAWELITNNNYCDIGISLGMLYTLYYSSYPYKDTLKLQGFRLKKSHSEYNLLLCQQGKYTLNYNVGDVVNIQSIPSDAEHTYTITISELKI
jgi:hypothetical protein